jgi:putative transposase
VSFWRLFYHIVWATRDRQPEIDEQRAVLLERAIRSACNDHDVIFHALTLMPDHVHLVASIPPRFAIADLMHRVKGMSSHMLNDTAEPISEPFAWQAEYGVLSLGERSLADVVAYVQNQPAHHAAQEIRPIFEITERPHPPADHSPGGAS